MMDISHDIPVSFAVAMPIYEHQVPIFHPGFELSLIDKPLPGVRITVLDDIVHVIK